MDPETHNTRVTLGILLSWKDFSKIVQTISTKVDDFRGPFAEGFRKPGAASRVRLPIRLPPWISPASPAPETLPPEALPPGDGPGGRRVRSGLAESKPGAFRSVPVVQARATTGAWRAEACQGDLCEPLGRCRPRPGHAHEGQVKAAKYIE